MGSPTPRCVGWFPRRRTGGAGREVAAEGPYREQLAVVVAPGGKGDEVGWRSFCGLT